MEAAMRTAGADNLKIGVGVRTASVFRRSAKGNWRREGRVVHVDCCYRIGVGTSEIQLECQYSSKFGGGKRR